MPQRSLPLFFSRRSIHSTSHPLGPSTNGPDDEPELPSDFRIPEPIDPEVVDQAVSHPKDQFEYAKMVSTASFRRWKEAEHPKGTLNFMSFGREFALTNNLTQGANMSLNHLRELRAYYRKIMYEMPQLKSTFPQLSCPISFI